MSNEITVTGWAEGGRAKPTNAGMAEMVLQLSGRPSSIFERVFGLRSAEVTKKNPAVKHVLEADKLRISFPMALVTDIAVGAQSMIKEVSASAHAEEAALSARMDKTRQKEEEVLRRFNDQVDKIRFE